MKKIHKFKLDDNHFVVVYRTNSKSNYNRFVTVINKSNPNTNLWGTTAKETSTKQDYLDLGNHGLNLLKKEECNINLK